MAVPVSEEAIRRRLLTAQKNEITEYHIYRGLAGFITDSHNRGVLEHIAGEELDHYAVWKGYTGEEVSPDRLKIFLFTAVSRIFGLTFGIKLMEEGEDRAQLDYAEIADFVPDAERIVRDEERHEEEILDLLDEGRLKYVSSVVLGLNGAFVEMTGTLAGLSPSCKVQAIATRGSCRFVPRSIHKGVWCEWLVWRAAIQNKKQAGSVSLLHARASFVQDTVQSAPHQR
jgi:vacuolar iron transporter family protein